MSDATQIFNSLLRDDKDGAQAAFDETIKSKLGDAREIRKIKLTADIFNTGNNNETNN
tara:strand:+ start:81 stop:254 length:174 start_codon:yes stop_codon:yes gene_type:complete